MRTWVELRPLAAADLFVMTPFLYTLQYSRAMKCRGVTLAGDAVESLHFNDHAFRERWSHPPQSISQSAK